VFVLLGTLLFLWELVLIEIGVADWGVLQHGLSWYEVQPAVSHLFCVGFVWPFPRDGRVCNQYGTR